MLHIEISEFKHFYISALISSLLSATPMTCLVCLMKNTFCLILQQRLVTSTQNRSLRNLRTDIWRDSLWENVWSASVLWTEIGSIYLAEMFGTYLVRTSDVILGHLEVLYVPHHAFQANNCSTRYLESGHHCRFPNPCQFTIHHYLLVKICSWYHC